MFYPICQQSLLWYDQYGRSEQAVSGVADTAQVATTNAKITDNYGYYFILDVNTVYNIY